MSSTTSQQSLDGTPAERLARRLQSIRQRLVDSDTYLGKRNNSFLKNLSWECVERGYQLVVKNESNTEEPGGKRFNCLYQN